jgi:hypothetical protein
MGGDLKPNGTEAYLMVDIKAHNILPEIYKTFGKLILLPSSGDWLAFY